MVEVRVREQNQIDARQFARRQWRSDEALRTDRGESEISAHAWEQDWISENVHPEEIDQHRRVTEPGRGDLAIVPLRWLRFVLRQRDRTARFLDRLPDEARRTAAGEGEPRSGSGGGTQGDKMSARKCSLLQMQSFRE